MMESCSRQHWGIHKLVFGALLLINGFLWPRWLGVDGWIEFIAVLMILTGFLKLVWPKHGSCCETPVTPTKGVAKKGKKK